MNSINTEKFVLIDINGKQYKVSTRIFLNDIEKISDIVNGEVKDYRRDFAEFLFEKIVICDEDKPSLHVLLNQWNLEKCIDTYVGADEKLKEFYEGIVVEKDIYEAFFIAIYEKNHEIVRQTAEGLSHMTKEILSEVSVSASQLGQNLISNMAASMAKSAQEIVRQISEVIEKMAADVAQMIRNIPIPTITQERKEELIASYKTWGIYGWTVMPDVPALGFEECPEDIKKANRIALEYCRAADMEYLFELLREVRGVKKSDLEEAIFNFKNKKYKSCALLLFSLIDAKMIRLQRQEDRNPKNKQRPAGAEAARNIFQHMKEEKNLEERFITLLFCENVLACLQIVFAKGKDFKEQPKVINRNFVNHGMMTRKVSRKDCVQLFLLYYNLLLLLEKV